MIDIDKIINKQLIKKNEDHNRKRQIGEYYATDLGTCIRKSWYKYQEWAEEEIIDEEDEEELGKKLRIFERGHVMQDWITERLEAHVKEIGGTLREEVSVVIPCLEEQFVIRGRIDNLIQTQEGYQIIEVKSTARIPSPRGKKIMPQPHHVAQVMPYLLYSPNAKAGILYIEPASLKTVFYEVKFDRFAMGELWKKAKDLHHCLIDNILPVAEAKRVVHENWQCKYCEFIHVCDAQPIASVAQNTIPINGCKQETEDTEIDEILDGIKGEE